VPRLRRVAALALCWLFSCSAFAAPDAAAVMDWAQRTYPILFPGTPSTTTQSPFVYRYYSSTRNYLGVANQTVFVLGPLTNNALVAVGSLSDFTCRIYPEQCVTATAADLSGVYTAYATHGERYTLTLDAGQGTYEFRGLVSTGYTASGRFTAGAQARSYLFTGSGVANKGFRSVNGLVVGSFDFGPGTVPFVAARNFATSAAEAAGVYNNLGVTAFTDGTRDSAIYSSRIDADGTLHICNHGTVYAIGLCPFEAVQTYTLTVSGTQFTATPASSNITGGLFTFRVALAGGERTYLMTGLNTTSGTRFFRIGVPESGDFPAGSALGGTTLGEWGTANFTGTSYASSGIGASGQPVSLTGSLGTPGLVGPTGLRIFQSGGSGFAIQNTAVAVLVGARSGTGAGYMQVGAK
jgi:hypothetical protein